MTIYIHRGNGFYVGSCVVVAAFSYDQAKEMIREKLDSAGLSNEELKVTPHDITEPGVLYFDNGDY